MTDSISISANGTETYAALLARLWAALDKTKITPKSTLYVTGLQSVYHMTNILSNGVIMGNCLISSSLLAMSSVTMLNNYTNVSGYENNTYTDYSSLTASGRVGFSYQ